MIIKIILVWAWIMFVTSFLGYLILALAFGREKADEFMMCGEGKNERRNR